MINFISQKAILKRKGVLLLFTIMLAAIAVDAQDVIYTTDQEEIQCLIIDLSPAVIKYKAFQQPNGPVYSIAIEKVEKIKYQSGKIITFKKSEPNETTYGEKPRLEEPQKARNTFGWHLGLGGSKIYGDIEGTEWLMVTTIGATFNLSLGGQSSLMLGADIMSLGSGLEDYAFVDTSNTLIEITGWQQNMGYIGLTAMYRQYLNMGNNYFAEGGFYGSFLLSADWEGTLTLTDSTGQIYEENFRDDLRDFYNGFDYGLTFGIGGRIPIDKKDKWHLSLEARFYYGLANIINKDYFIDDYKESMMFGFFIVGVDLPSSSE
jgi:hypothetical protein